MKVDEQASGITHKFATVMDLGKLFGNTPTSSSQVD
jgi:hypothetical protein